MASSSSIPQLEARQEHNRGVAFAQARDYPRAIECFRRAVALDPGLFAAWANLGALLTQQGRLDEALISLQTAVRLNPDSPEAHNNLANALSSLGQLDQAVRHCRLSLALRPDNSGALNALGNALKDQGLLDEAIAAYRRAAEIRPDLIEPASNYLYALHFCPNQTAQSILEAHREWNRRHAVPLRLSHKVHPNLPVPTRKLKIGYLSADFGEHPVGRFILPLLTHHDRERFEVFCYANLLARDSMTEDICSQADGWREIAPLSDEEVCQAIRGDGIDILIDLTMHMRSSRLLVFARRPAPVQVTYLAYCSTTGLDAIDYRLTDPFLDPAGTDVNYVERSVRLPRSYWCYSANDAAPAANALPAGSSGTITFACLNNFCKVTPPTLSLWAELMRRIPNSRLILHTTLGTHCDRVRNALGIGEERLSFVGRVPMAEYFARYHAIDIALDPFPCAGGTTTCDALWMGVPVITLPGETAVSRSGASILSNTGCGEWIARSGQDYLRIAEGLCADLDGLAKRRESLREQMLRSPLMDATRFARDVEDAYRGIWRTWCDGAKNPRKAGG